MHYALWKHKWHEVPSINFQVFHASLCLLFWNPTLKLYHPRWNHLLLSFCQNNSWYSHGWPEPYYELLPWIVASGLFDLFIFECHLAQPAIPELNSWLELPKRMERQNPFHKPIGMVTCQLIYLWWAYQPKVHLSTCCAMTFCCLLTTS